MGTSWRYTPEGELEIFPETGTASLYCDGEHLQKIVEEIRHAAEMIGITIL
jgi:hypothetical protein